MRSTRLTALSAIVLIAVLARGSNAATEPGRRRPPPYPPPTAIAACNAKSVGAACSFDFDEATLDGVCRRVPVSDVPVCVPHDHPPPER